MGSKRNPGGFDCYEKAKPDEPMFVLLARDPYASTLVRIWKLMHEDDTDCEKTDEALRCADAMDAWEGGNTAVWDTTGKVCHNCMWFLVTHPIIKQGVEISGGQCRKKCTNYYKISTDGCR